MVPSTLYGNCHGRYCTARNHGLTYFMPNDVERKDWCRELLLTRNCTHEGPAKTIRSRPYRRTGSTHVTQCNTVHTKAATLPRGRLFQWHRPLFSYIGPETITLQNSTTAYDSGTNRLGGKLSTLKMGSSACFTPVEYATRQAFTIIFMGIITVYFSPQARRTNEHLSRSLYRVVLY